mgnify:CR=1 FL=1
MWLPLSGAGCGDGGDGAERSERREEERARGDDACDGGGGLRGRELCCSASTAKVLHQTGIKKHG